MNRIIDLIWILSPYWAPKLWTHNEHVHVCLSSLHWKQRQWPTCLKSANFSLKYRAKFYIFLPIFVMPFFIHMQRRAGLIGDLPRKVSICSIHDQIVPLADQFFSSFLQPQSIWWGGGLAVGLFNFAATRKFALPIKKNPPIEFHSKRITGHSPSQVFLQPPTPPFIHPGERF